MTIIASTSTTLPVADDPCFPRSSCAPASCAPAACVPPSPRVSPSGGGPATLVMTCGPDDCGPALHCVPDRECGPSNPPVAEFLWLDLTRDCMLACGHCYNESGPGGDRELLTLLGSPTASLMRPEDWLSVLDQAAGSGVAMVQFIGGEPTMYSAFARVLTHAVMIGLRAEVYSNLVHIRDAWWSLFQHPSVSLATSYYSDDPDEHDEITGRDSHRKTRANIVHAIELGIDLRVGIVQVNESQRIREARADLERLGVRPDRIGVDRVRAFGRGRGEHTACDVNELCGHCGDGRAAIGPDGTVTPCIMSAWLKAGNVRTETLADILTGDGMARATAVIPRRTTVADPCDPGAQCRPDAYPCQPQNGG